MMKNLTAFLCFLWLGMTCVIAQEYSGVLLNQVDSKPLYPASIQIEGTDKIVYTEESGAFSFDHICNGSFVLILSSGDFEEQQRFDCSQKDLGTIYFSSRTVNDLDQIFATNLNLDESDQIAQDNISGLLTASRDAFNSAAAFNWGPARFRVRGYDSKYTEMFLNGMPVNKLDNGRVIWGQWGGLNDVTRLQNNNLGLLATDFTVGNIGGTNAIDLRASSQRPQTRLTMSATNRNYRYRSMLTHSSGMMENGWAYTLSASHRWAQEGYVPGTWYDAYGYFLSVDKKINERNTLNFVALGAPSRRGGQGPAQAEMHDLADDNYYNPYWGFQNGEKRNSRVGTYHQPIFMLRHDYELRNKLSITTNVSYQFGRAGTTALDWFNAQDPRPDYYRKLPSFFDDPSVAAQVEERLRNNEADRQIRWDELYAANQADIDLFEDVDGIEGNDLTGFRSQYIVSERRFDGSEILANTALNYIASDDLSLQGGLYFRKYTGEAYNLVDDLLGGDFYVDLDRFALQDFPDNPDAAQNDLLRPNRVVREGDRYAHDYKSHIIKSKSWVQAQWSKKRIDPYVGISLSQTRFWREGLVQKGLFPDRSLGESEKYDFLNYKVKGGATVKLDGRNYIHVGGFYGTEAPTFRDAFVSPRTRNDAIIDLEDRNETLRGGEISYNLRSPNLKVKVLGYYTEILDKISTRSFYHDDLRTFVNFSVSDIDTRHMGLELAADYNITSALNFHAAAAIGEYIITSRPSAVITQDNNAEQQLAEYDLTVYAKNIHLGGTPQSAYNAGLTYRSKDYWSLFLNVNYFDRIFLPYNPVRRTTFAVDGLDPKSERYASILEQEQFEGQMTVDLSFFKSWKVDWIENKSSFISVSLNVNNLLNNQDFRTGGFEQFRFDFADQDPNAFPPKYFFFNGLNYFVNVNYRFY